MQRHHWARLGLALTLAPWLAAALAVAGYFAFIHLTEASTCTTDTECMERHGGDGGPDTHTEKES